MEEQKKDIVEPLSPVEAIELEHISSLLVELPEGRESEVAELLRAATRCVETKCLSTTAATVGIIEVFATRLKAARCETVSLRTALTKAQEDGKRMRKAMEKIVAWNEFPSTGKFWDNQDGSPSDRPMSYGACYGSNGERDHMRSIAESALSALPSPASGQETKPCSLCNGTGNIRKRREEPDEPCPQCASAFKKD